MEGELGETGAKGIMANTSETCDCIRKFRILQMFGQFRT